MQGDEIFALVVAGLFLIGGVLTCVFARPLVRGGRKGSTRRVRPARGGVGQEGATVELLSGGRVFVLPGGSCSIGRPFSSSSDARAIILHDAPSKVIVSNSAQGSRGQVPSRLLSMDQARRRETLPGPSLLFWGRMMVGVIIWSVFGGIAVLVLIFVSQTGRVAEFRTAFHVVLGVWLAFCVVGRVRCEPWRANSGEGRARRWLHDDPVPQPGGRSGRFEDGDRAS